METPGLADVTLRSCEVLEGAGEMLGMSMLPLGLENVLRCGETGEEVSLASELAVLLPKNDRSPPDGFLTSGTASGFFSTIFQPVGKSSSGSVSVLDLTETSHTVVPLAAR